MGSSSSKERDEDLPVADQLEEDEANSTLMAYALGEEDIATEATRISGPLDVDGMGRDPEEWIQSQRSTWPEFWIKWMEEESDEEINKVYNENVRRYEPEPDIPIRIKRILVYNYKMKAMLIQSYVRTAYTIQTDYLSMDISRMLGGLLCLIDMKEGKPLPEGWMRLEKGIVFSWTLAEIIYDGVMGAYGLYRKAKFSGDIFFSYIMDPETMESKQIVKYTLKRMVKEYIELITEILPDMQLTKLERREMKNEFGAFKHMYKERMSKLIQGLRGKKSIKALKTPVQSSDTTTTKFYCNNCGLLKHPDKS